MRLFLLFSLFVVSVSTLAKTNENVQLLDSYSTPPALDSISDHAFSTDKAHLYVLSNPNAQKTAVLKFNWTGDNQLNFDHHLNLGPNILTKFDKAFKLMPLTNDFLVLFSNTTMVVLDDSGAQLKVAHEYDLASEQWAPLAAGFASGEYSDFYKKIIGLKQTTGYSIYPEFRNDTQLFAIDVAEDGSLSLDSTLTDADYNETYRPVSVSVADNGRIFVGHIPDNITNTTTDFSTPRLLIGQDSSNAAIAEFTLADNGFSLVKQHLPSSDYQADTTAITSIKVRGEQLFAYDSGVGQIIVADLDNDLSIKQVLTTNVTQHSFNADFMDVSADASAIALSGFTEDAVLYKKNDSGTYIYDKEYSSPVNHISQTVFDGEYWGAMAKVEFATINAALVKIQTNDARTSRELDMLTGNGGSDIEHGINPIDNVADIIATANAQFVIEKKDVQLVSFNITDNKLAEHQVLWQNPVPTDSMFYLGQYGVTNNNELIYQAWNYPRIEKKSNEDSNLNCYTEEAYAGVSTIAFAPDSTLIYLGDNDKDEITVLSNKDNYEQGCLIELSSFSIESNSEVFALGTSVVVKGENLNEFSVYQQQPNSDSFAKKASIALASDLHSEYLEADTDKNGELLFVFTKTQGIKEYKWDDNAASLQLLRTIAYPFTGELQVVDRFSNPVDKFSIDNAANLILLRFQYIGLDQQKHYAMHLLNRNSQTPFSDYDLTSEIENNKLVKAAISSDGSRLLATGESKDTLYLYELKPVDSDGDGVLDKDDAFPADPTETLDTDKDGIGNNADTDDDNDGVLDADDAFPLDASESVDTDNDGIGNNADTDDDNDGVLDTDDAFPLDALESVDTDSDGIGNNADTDDDNDGVLDADDAFPLDASESVDTDSDGIGNNADTDDDNDGVPDTRDAFPLDAAESVDTDNDGIGNNADTDDDNDGVADSQDAFPLDANRSEVEKEESGGSVPPIMLTLLSLLCFRRKQRH